MHLQASGWVSLSTALNSFQYRFSTSLPSSLRQCSHLGFCASDQVLSAGRRITFRWPRIEGSSAKIRVFFPISCVATTDNELSSAFARTSHFGKSLNRLRFMMLTGKFPVLSLSSASYGYSLAPLTFPALFSLKKRRSWLLRP